MSPTGRLQLALVNDYEVVVHGVASMLRHYGSIEFVEVDVSGEPTIPDEVDVVLFDTFAHGQGDSDAVIDLVERLSARDEPGHVVVYSWNTDPHVIRRSLDGGAAGYLGKSLTAAELVDALHSVGRGETVVRPEPQGAAVAAPGGWPGREEGLTPRESEVLALITRGMTNEQIAQLTQLSPNSIKSYIRGAYRKIGVDSRTRAVLWGIEHGFTPDRQA